jgi:hypothetical protein
VGDEMYGSPSRKEMGLRAIELAYADPFTKRPIRIRAPIEEFCRRYGFQIPKRDEPKPTSDARGSEVKKDSRE